MVSGFVNNNNTTTSIRLSSFFYLLEHAVFIRPFSLISEGKEALANPDCDAMNLLDYVAFKCGWNRKDAKNSKNVKLIREHR